MATMPLVSPTPIPQSKQKRKRRPTRTPKPSTQSIHGASRIYSPSPFLDRSFHRKKLLFDTNKNDETDSESEYITDSQSSSDHDSNDSEYDINDDLQNECDSDQREEDEEKNEIKSSGKTSNHRASTNELMDDIENDIENLSIGSNTNYLLRNVRSSIKMQTNGDTMNSPKVQTPDFFMKSQPKIKKKKSNNISKPISDTNKRLKPYKKPSIKSKSTTVRITKSNRLFSKCHSFGDLLVKPLECGSGCPLYRSNWKMQQSVTKLMPLFENEEFSKEENVDNALREFEFHADIYRKGCKLYGIDECPVVAIYGCVSLKHYGECVDGKDYLSFVMPQLHCNLAQFVNKYRKLTQNEGYMLLNTGIRFLSLLNDANMVHCDIKPENIFIDVIFDNDDEIKINKFVFGDFGCSALKTEEFPYGNLTGTVTMWDLEALGAKYGDEDGFDMANDLYGFIGSLLDGMYGGSIMEELLEEEDEKWEETDWKEYTQLIRICRRKMCDIKFIEEELNDIKCKDGILRTVLMQIGKPRDQRMTLQQMQRLVH